MNTDPSELSELASTVLLAMSKSSPEQELASERINLWLEELVPQIIAQENYPLGQKTAADTFISVSWLTAILYTEKHAKNAYQKQLANSAGQTLVPRLQKLTEKIEQGWHDGNWYLGYMRSHCKWQRLATLQTSTLQKKTANLLSVSEVVDLPADHGTHSSPDFQDIMCNLIRIHHELSSEEFTTLLLRVVIGLSRDSVAKVLAVGTDQLARIEGDMNRKLLAILTRYEPLSDS